MDRPILFSAPMVRALLDGRKTQTRRILKSPYGTMEWSAGEWKPIITKTRAGDRLWVRESGQLLREAYDHDPRCGEDVWRDAGFYHSADGEIIEARSYDPPLREWIDDCSRVNRPSIHMPRWASRLTLTVTDVRVQRLQEISEEDARAEGITDGGCLNCGFPEPCGCAHPHPDARQSFSHLWQSINGPDSWQANPWVAAYTFTVAHQNIDAPTSGASHV